MGAPCRVRPPSGARCRRLPGWRAEGGERGGGGAARVGSGPPARRRFRHLRGADQLGAGQLGAGDVAHRANTGNRSGAEEELGECVQHLEGRRVVEVYPLRRATRAALQRWFLVRRLLMVEVTGGADWLWVSVRGNHGGVVAEGVEPEYRPAGTALQPRGVARSYTSTVAKVNTSLAGTEAWEPLPTRMEQLRRGVAEPEVHLVPPAPDAERAARFMTDLEEAGRQLAALPDAESGGDRRPRRPPPGPLRPAGGVAGGDRAPGAARRSGLLRAVRARHPAHRVGAGAAAGP